MNDLAIKEAGEMAALEVAEVVCRFWADLRGTGGRPLEIWVEVPDVDGKLKTRESQLEELMAL